MERHVEKRTNPLRSTAETRRTHEMSLAMWLQNGRAAKGMSLDDVARVTKIQPRILERLEAGKLDGLPAEVFVRGFVRSFARCVGLDEDEALRRYGACAPTTSPAANAARAMVEAMGDLAPNARAKQPPKTLRDEVIPPEVMAQGSLEMPATAEVEGIGAVVGPAIFAEASDVISVPIEKVDAEVVFDAAPEPIAPPAVDAAVEPKKAKRTKRAPGTTPKRTRRKAVGTPSEATPVVATPDAAAVTAKPRRTRKKKSTEAPPIAATEIVAAPVETAPAPEAVEVSIDLSPGLAASTAARQGADDVWVSDLWASEMSAPCRSSTSAVAEPIPDTTLDAASARDEAPDAATTRFERPDDIDGIEVTIDADVEAGTWVPKIPAVVTTTAPAPWRRPNYAAAPALVAVIDDADPDSAERALEDRRNTRESRRSFLPPILLDREGDRSARQGGLTLAVIILLIAATLTLSYLMRRPSATGDGVTRVDRVEKLDTLA